MVTDRQTDTQTHRPSTVTLAAHARQGLNIMQDIATKSIHINTGADEFCCIEISFLPGRISSLTLLVLMSSVLTNYVSVCTGAG